MSMQIKKCVLLICSDSFKHYQISQGIVFGSPLQINSLISEEGGESLFVYRGIKLCRFPLGVEDTASDSSSELLAVISVEDFYERACNMQRG